MSRGGVCPSSSIPPLSSLRISPGSSFPPPMPSPKVDTTISARTLLTTIAGSLPKPAWLSPPNQLWAPWLLEGERLAEGKRDAVRVWLAEQTRAGIDIVTDGEQ